MPTYIPCSCMTAWCCSPSVLLRQRARRQPGKRRSIGKEDENAQDVLGNHRLWNRGSAGAREHGARGQAPPASTQNANENGSKNRLSNRDSPSSGHHGSWDSFTEQRIWSMYRQPVHRREEEENLGAVEEEEEQQDLAHVVGVADLTRSSSGPALAARLPIRVRSHDAPSENPHHRWAWRLSYLSKR
jgi:hypothetical protein